jgi:hypothetical protein
MMSPPRALFQSARLRTTLAAFLLTCSAACGAQTWSPDGARIAVGGKSLTIVDATPRGAQPAPANAAQPVPPGPRQTGPASQPVWSPDGNTIGYIDAKDRVQLFDVATGRSSPGPELVRSEIAWAPDSKTYALIGAGTDSHVAALTKYRDGGTALEAELPVRFEPALRCCPVGWVAGTDNIVICGGDNERNDLCLVEQGQAIRLSTGLDVIGFRVSADGSHVLWARRSRNARYILFSLYSLDIQQRSLKTLKFPPVLQDVNPDAQHAPDAILAVVFSPDLQHLCFAARNAPGAGGPDSITLYCCDVNGKGVRLLGHGSMSARDTSAPGPAVSGQPAGPEIDLLENVPAFSPDGKRIAFVLTEAGTSTIQVVDIGSGDTQTIPVP